MVRHSLNITEIEGNLIDLAFKGKFEIIAHGCNCYRTMGSGIAGQIAKRIPEAYQADLRNRVDPSMKLGNFTSVIKTVNDDIQFTVLNLYTQGLPGPHIDYTALRLCLRKVNSMYKNFHIGIPYIGSGIAGGNWNNIILEIIKEELKDLQVTIVKYKK